MDCYEVKLFNNPYCSCVSRRVKIGVVKKEDAPIRKLAAMYHMLDFRAFVLLFEIK